MRGQGNTVQPLLPPAERVVIQQERTRLDSRRLDAHDAVLLVSTEENAAAVLATLPDADVWRALHRAARTRAANVISARAASSKHPVIAIGFAKRSAQMFERLTLSGRLWKEIASCSPRRILLATPGVDRSESSHALQALLAATLAGNAQMPTLKSKPAPAASLKHITLLHDSAKIDIETVLATHHGNHLARWLSTLPPNYLNSKTYARALGVLSKQHAWRMRFLGERALKRLGAGAFLAVAQANAHRDAGIVHLSRRVGARRCRGRIALVGKGVCFDTGGINLKTQHGMYHMHADMQGSAVAVGTLLALTLLDAPLDIDCWLALTENEIGPKAYRPQDVVTAADGTTIQVAHSDAEGRMALADTLVLAAREQPNLILDFATLTGACVTALTERMSGVFTNRPAWRDSLETAGRVAGERVWGFPLDDDYDSDLESSIADVLQCTPDSKGDHILAARFLNRFVPKDIPWVHLDLSASRRTGGLAHIGTEMTGFGVRYATELLVGETAKQMGLLPTS
jgi:leucyl aminopeptidase